MQQVQHSMDEITKSWPNTAREAVQTMIEKYGPPDEYSASQVIWHNNGPWLRTVVSADEVLHQFPAPHVDVLEQFIAYRVPPDKFDALAYFDGSVIVERTKGLISARCAGEEMNFVALNLANDIITGKYSVEEARNEYIALYKAYQNGEKPPYTQGFQFDVPQNDTGDPDVAVVD